MAEQYQFKAEIQQLLNILVHSLYTDREIFLRELISNGSDAINRVQFEMLTNADNVADADAELAIEVTADEEAGTLTISDTGIGMTQDDMVNNLGVIAYSGAKAFIEALKDKPDSAQDIIGQFGVGFYSAFMVADKIRVVSRSHHKDGQAYAWESDGGESYTVEPAEREARGTDVILYLKDDAKDFLQSWTLKDVVRRHSNYVTYPIYVGEEEEATNKQQALWRQESKDITDEQYTDFYKMMTLDFNDPLHRIHMRADVPLQFYALMYIPGTAERSLLSPRTEPGLQLYARKILIQDYTTDLLPDYLQFVQGVVDSEDLPLNINRESVQANRVMATLKKTLTNKVLTELKRMAKNRFDDYEPIYEAFGRYLKQGVTMSPEDRDDLEKLYYFASTSNDTTFLADYVERMVDNQEDIYYILGEDDASASRSPHLDAFRKRNIEVLYFTDPVDPVMLMGLTEFDGHQLRNVDEADIDLSGVGTEQEDEDTDEQEPLAEPSFDDLRQRFSDILGERVLEVRASDKLVGSAARLVSRDNDPQRNMFRINRLLDREYQLPVKILELNPRHPLLHNLSGMLGSNTNNPLINVVIEQVFETALLQDGIHPDPAAMANRLQLLMQAATGTPSDQLNFPQVIIDPGKSNDAAVDDDADPAAQ